MLEVMMYVLVVLVALLVPVCIDLAKRLVKMEDRLHFSQKASLQVHKEQEALIQQLTKKTVEMQEWQWMYERECEAHAETQEHLDWWTGACQRAWDKLEEPKG